MGQHPIDARNTIQEIIWDAQRQLKERVPAKQIKKNIEKRLNRLKDDKYTKIKW